MRRVIPTTVILASVLILSSISLTADVRTRERSAIKFEGMLGRVVGMFGGKAARDGIVSTTMVKGDRKATMTDTTGEIIDLSEEKIYNLDLKRRTYEVTTFEELRQRMREAQERAEKQAQEQKEEPTQDPTAEVEFDFDVKETGQRKQIAGHDARQVIMTVAVRPKGQTLEEGGGLVMTADSWIGPKLAAMDEVNDFNMRYWKQLQGPEMAAMSAQQMATVLAMYPMIGKAMERLKQEGTKLEGTVLAQTTTFESVRSKAAMAEQQKSQGGGGLGGMLARRIRKDDGAKPRATIMTMDHEVQDVGTNVDASALAIPEGFKERK
jgi:hypothetical protein